jgi:cell division protein FtsZ
VAELQQHVDSLITIPNERLLEVLGKNTSLLDAFKEANDVLLGAVQGIADLIIRPGMINVDFADVRTVMSEMGMAMMGTGAARGENRAREAAERAINSPLLDNIDLQGARGILVNITAGVDLGLGEFSEVGDTIEEFASEEATVVVGTVIDPNITDELRVTVVATGLGAEPVRVPLQVVDSSHRRARQPAPASTTHSPRPRVAATPRPERAEGSAEASQAEAALREEQRANEAEAAQPDYSRYEQPPAQRKVVGGADFGGEYFDIPTFLRRQVD